MGPRSTDRGNGGVRQALVRRINASMGPRSTDRGNRLVVNLRRKGYALQWGRDRLIAEIRVCPRVLLWNDQASMGPRSTDRGNCRSRKGFSSIVSLLQWGRDRLIAEIFSPPGAVCAGSALQWGRDRLIAEMLPMSKETYGKAPLQWGRDRLIAEIPPRRSCRCRPSSFNGAA